MIAVDAADRQMPSIPAFASSVTIYCYCNVQNVSPHAPTVFLLCSFRFAPFPPPKTFIVRASLSIRTSMLYSP
jgi:hypothetical protein